MLVDGNVTFKNNAGIKMEAGTNFGANFSWQSATAKLVTTGTGIIDNSGGTFSKFTGPGTVISDLPYVQNGQNAEHSVLRGTLTFSRPLNGSFSVIINQGQLKLGTDGPATLEAIVGVLFNNGTLSSLRQATIVGELNVRGGVLDIGGNSIDTLNVTGHFVMTGGEYRATVNLTDMTADRIAATATITLGGQSSLRVQCIQVPNPIPPNQAIVILESTAALPTIAGDFSFKILDIAGTDKKMTTSKNAAGSMYRVVTPAA